MALICDTGGVYALYDADDAHHLAVRAVVEAEIGPLYLPAILLAELDYLLTTRLGIDAEFGALLRAEDARGGERGVEWGRNRARNRRGARGRRY